MKDTQILKKQVNRYLDEILAIDSELAMVANLCEAVDVQGDSFEPDTVVNIGIKIKNHLVRADVLRSYFLRGHTLEKYKTSRTVDEAWLEGEWVRLKALEITGRYTVKLQG